MRIAIAILCVSVFAMTCAPFSTNTLAGTVENEGGLQAISESANEFALDFYKRIASHNENLFLSPYSIYSIFAMVYGGARGNTAAEMERTFHFPLSGSELHEYVGRVSSAINSTQVSDAIRLDTANSLWPQDGYPLLKGYLDLVQRRYEAKISPLDYGKDPEGARKAINNWVEDKTRHKITNLLKPGMINTLTRMVLVNAIYFKGDWQSQFDRNNTEDCPFFLLSGETVKVPLMTIRRSYRYNDVSEAQILELPYAGKDISMLVVLPKKKDGLREVENALSKGRLKVWTSTMHPRDIIVYLPRFHVTSEFTLDRVLASMGMVDAFDPQKADFSGMDGQKGTLFIGVAIHKAYADINEEGTEAAATTAAGIRTTSMPIPPPVFRADRPFLFMIRHNATGIVLFMGRIANPLKSLDT